MFFKVSFRSISVDYSCVAVAVGVSVGGCVWVEVGESVAVGAAVKVNVALGGDVSVGVFEAVRLGESVTVGVVVSVGVVVCVAVGVMVGVIGVRVPVGIEVPVGVTVAEAVALMREKHVSSLIVKNRSQEDAFGIITRKDVVNKVVDPGKDPADVKVFEIMTKPLVMVSPGLALKYCARLMNVAGIRRAPVFDGKKIIGMLSNTDIFNAL